MYHRRHFIVLVALVGLLLSTLAQPTAAQPATPRVSSGPRPSRPAITAPAVPRPAGSIYGRVVLRGQARRQATYILALRDAAIVRQAPIDPGDTYALRDLEPGSYTLRVVDQQQRPLALLSDTEVRLAPGQARRPTLTVDGSDPDTTPLNSAPAAAPASTIPCCGRSSCRVRSTCRSSGDSAEGSTNAS